MRLVDISLSLPGILIAVLLSVVFEPSFTNVIIVVVFLLWPSYARLVRGETLGLKQQEFVALARVAGCSSLTIMFRHIVPNLMPSILVLATLHVGYVIVLEAALSFLGVGHPAAHAVVGRDGGRRPWPHRAGVVGLDPAGHRHPGHRAVAEHPRRLGARPPRSEAPTGVAGVQRSDDRILTTHTGSLPRARDLVGAAPRARGGPAARRRRAPAPGADGGARRRCGSRPRSALSVVNDGEQGRVDYTVYVKDRLTGLRRRERAAAERRRRGVPRVDRDGPAVRAAVPAPPGLHRSRDLEGLAGGRAGHRRRSRRPRAAARRRRCS